MRKVTKATFKSQKHNWPIIIAACVFAVIGTFFLYKSFAVNPNLPGDVNNDNRVDLTDLSQLLSRWNTQSTTHDLNGDGLIALQDLSILLSNWNKTYTPPGPTPTPPTPTPPTPQPGVFTGPLKVSSNQHYFVDQNNRPFLYVADTVWTLTTISEADAKQFIDRRAAQGYTVIQVSLLGWDRSVGFEGGDMTKPKAAFFAKVDNIVAYAASKNVVLYLGTLWGGINLPSNQASSYGTFLGNRYKNATNILWFVGGDSAPDNGFATNKAIGQALKAANPSALISYHMWGLATPWHLNSEPWYGYFSYQWNGQRSPWTYMVAGDGYKQNPIKPFLNIEPAYEPTNANSTTTSVLQVRQNGWWVVLGGAAGVTYGGPGSVWNASSFGGADTNRPAAIQTGYINKILGPLAWEKLVPDFSHQAITSGYGSYGSTDYVTAGLANDGSLIVAYLPSNRAITVNLSKLSGAATAQWHDPSTGNTSGSSTNVTNSGSHQFTPPGNNAAGNSDWVLVIKR